MNCGYCKDCKHWNPPLWEGWGECKLSAGEYGEPKHPNTLSVAADCEGCCARLKTKPDFGCVQFEAK